MRGAAVALAPTPLLPSIAVGFSFMIALLTVFAFMQSKGSKQDATRRGEGFCINARQDHRAIAITIAFQRAGEMRSETVRQIGRATCEAFFGLFETLLENQSTGMCVPGGQSSCSGCRRRSGRSEGAGAALRRIGKRSACESRPARHRRTIHGTSRRHA
jgi:hypothetical protein